MVVHEAPAYRYGLARGLRDAGFLVHEASEADMAAGERWDACVLSIAGGADCKSLTTVRDAGTGAVVVVLSEPSPANFRLALEHGADGVVPYTVDLRELAWTVKAAMRGMALLPIEVVRSLGDVREPAPAAADLPHDVAEWLALLSHGASVAEIARKAGYSERQMYRVMQDVYQSMGARNRAEAIALAARWGLSNPA